MTLLVKNPTDQNSAADSTPRKRKSIVGSIVFRIAISAALLFWLLHKTDLNSLAQAFLNANWLLLVLAQITAILSVIILTARWSCVLRAMGARMPFRGLLQSNFVGLYFNLFTPSNVGQDAARILDFRTGANSTSTGLASVAVDRMLGLLAMLAFAVGMFPFAARALPNTRAVGMAVGVVSLALFCVVAVIWSPVGRPVAGLAGRFLPEKITAKLRKIHKMMVTMTSHPLSSLASVGLALTFMFLVVLTNYLIGAAVGIRASFFTFMFVIPLALIVAAIPISINGLGLREGAYISLWGAFHVGREQALVMSLVFFATWVVIGMIGMVVYLTRRNVLHSQANSDSK